MFAFFSFEVGNLQSVRTTIALNLSGVYSQPVVPHIYHLSFSVLRTNYQCFELSFKGH